MSSSARFTQLLLLLVCLVVSCGSDPAGSADGDAGGPGSPGGIAPTGAGDSASADMASGDADDSGGPAADGSPGTADAAPVEDAPDGADGAGSPVLPPCDRACDRVVDCGVAACEGYDWATAPLLVEACLASCEDGWAAEVLAAPRCIEVLALAEDEVADFTEGCEGGPCLDACEKLAGCIVDECPQIPGNVRPLLAADCQKGCQPQMAAWVLQNDCDTLVAQIAGADPSFQMACYGQEVSCPGPELCGPYAEKVTGCIAQHCEATIEPYLEGIEALIQNYCEGDPECPSEVGVKSVLGEKVTCDSPPLDKVGPSPPFDGLCKNGMEVTLAQLTAACDKFMNCPGTEWIESQSMCMVLIALRPDAAAVVQCVAGSSGCTGMYNCFKGP